MALFRGIQEYIALDVNNIARVESRKVNISWHWRYIPELSLYMTVEKQASIGMRRRFTNDSVLNDMHN